MRYNREDIRDKLLERCFPDNSKDEYNKNQLRMTRLKFDVKVDQNDSVSNEIAFQKNPETPQSMSPSRVQPLRTFMRASSLITLQGKPVESSRYSPEPIVFKSLVKLEEKYSPRVNMHINPIKKDIAEYPFSRAAHSVTYIPRINQVQLLPQYNPTRHRLISPKSSTSLGERIKGHSDSSTAADSGVNNRRQMRVYQQKSPKAISIMTPMFKNTKPPQKISMRGATIRRQFNQKTSNPKPFENVITRLTSQNIKVEDYEQVQQSGQFLDGILAKICRPDCREDISSELKLNRNRDSMNKTHSGFLRTSTKWYNKS